MIVKGSGARRAADSAAERYALAGLCEDASDGMRLLCTECTDSGLRAMLGIAGGFVWYGCLTLDRDSRCLAPRLSRIGDGIWEVSYTVGDETRTRSFAISDIRRFLG